MCYYKYDFGPTRLQRPNLVRTEVAAIRDACDRRGIRVFLFLSDGFKIGISKAIKTVERDNTERENASQLIARKKDLAYTKMGYERSRDRRF